VVAAPDQWMKHVQRAHVGFLTVNNPSAHAKMGESIGAAMERKLH